MAGPAKKRAQAEKKPEGSSNGSSSASRDPTQRSVPKSIPRLDGNRDPGVGGVLDYTKPTDLKNISEFLGLAGWYQARGVSANALLVSARICMQACMHPPAQTLPDSTAHLHFPICKQAQVRTPVWPRLAPWMHIRHLSPLFLVFRTLSFLSFIHSFFPCTSPVLHHCASPRHHDFPKSNSPLLPGHDVLPSSTCEHWN